MSAEGRVQKFAADFKKVPGMLSLTATHVSWVPNEAGKTDRQSQSMARVINMLASKAGSAKTSLKLLFKDDLPAGGLHFTFTSPSSKEDDRKVVQDTLIPFVSANRAGPSAPAPAAPAANGAVDAPAASAPGTPSAVVTGKRKAMDGDASPSTPSAGTPGATNGSAGAGKSGRPENWRLRVKVLKKNPNLDLLYRELVIGKQITEAEFWEGREALLRAEELAQAQKPGRQSRLLDDRFTSTSTNKNVGGTGVGIKQKSEESTTVINLTKELVSELFEEFPVLQDAYARHVPAISETEFWGRYFKSSLWERHRASVRQSTSEEAARRRDDIFDAYLEDEPDWNPQPKKALPDHIERFLDLSATEEDHGESGTQRDVTMQAGRERTALPLIRRFNDHSNKLLRRGREVQVGGEDLERILPEDMDIYNEIDLEDLRGPAQATTIELEVQDTQDKAESKGEGDIRGIMPGKTDEELVDLASRHASNILDYELDFSSVSIPTPVGGWEKNRQDAVDKEAQARHYRAFARQKEGAETASLVIKEMHLLSNSEKGVNDPFPEQVLNQMKSCHNAATEFLRQYWSAILPLPPGALGGPSAGPQARANKAEKMAAYLRLTEGKVDGVVATATAQGISADRVRAAMSPTMGAVNVALERETKRLSKVIRA